ncbi:hypothetical protein BDP27DRAFT_1418942 [Rhodocollybia butyracea]|uniref:Uncharacterized protein n=1 Tax=Rhodocollybia butyracea TaxID=206335 RepID=A0A9P5PY82_9AGAR|nr:hypothetical protein BDP27DRAFT_1418942 [Rhodocollybia butyracea]
MRVALLLFMLIASSMLAVCIPVPGRARQPARKSTTPERKHKPHKHQTSASGRPNAKASVWLIIYTYLIPTSCQTVTFIDKTSKITGSETETEFPPDAQELALTIAINTAMGAMGVGSTSHIKPVYKGLYAPSEESGERDMVFFIVTDEEGHGGPWFGWAARGAKVGWNNDRNKDQINGKLAKRYAAVSLGNPTQKEFTPLVKPSGYPKKLKEWKALSDLFDRIFLNPVPFSFTEYLEKDHGIDELVHPPP